MIVSRAQRARLKTLAALACVVSCHADPPRSSTSSTNTLLGTFHYEGIPDAANLVVREDGTFAWSLEGCDFGGNNCGRWRRDGDALLLEPSGDAKHLGWLEDRCNLHVRITRGDDDSIVVDSGGHVRTWKRGALCAVCGPEGPTALQACSEPRVPPQCTQTRESSSCDS